MVNMGAILEKEYYHKVDTTAKNTLIEDILYDLELLLNGREMNRLNKILNEILEDYDILVNDDMDVKIENVDEFNEDLINRFEKIKKLEGLSNKSIEGYIREIHSFLDYIEKPLTHVTADDIREYLVFKQEANLIELSTLDNYRRYLNTFFRTLLLENIVRRNPVKKIERIKVPYRLKKPFTKEEIILMRMHINNLRDKAIFEMLLSSGVRVGELSHMKISDLNFDDNSIYVVGKGNKERKVYFSEECKVVLKMYLKERDDNNPYLFISHNKPHRRLNSGGVGITLRKLGRKAGVKKVHPHKFRKTMASFALNSGMPIEQVQKLLGHETIDTTTIYAITDDNYVSHSHKKYIE